MKVDAFAKSLFRVFARNEVTKQSVFISAGCQFRDCFASLAMTELVNASVVGILKFTEILVMEIFSI